MNQLSLIPILSVSAISGGMLLWSGTSKLQDLGAARVGVLDYRLVPPRFAMPLAAFIGAVELLCGLALLLGFPLAMPIALLLVAAFSLVALTALARGFRIECHCGDEGERLTVFTVWRNVSLLAALSLATIGVSGRSALAPMTLSLDLETATAIGLAVAVVVNSYVLFRALRIASLIPRGHKCGGSQ